ncbi:MAG: ribonuclease J [Nitrospiraceae bacterium]|nr:ribonuclease J [Nitrospiraceae bacterium]
MPSSTDSSTPLQIIPLGGVEEIGLNMTVFRFGSDIIVVDSGLMFPEEDMLGIDFVIPDFSYLIENRDSIRGILLTHGHEDHTGALPFVLNEIKAPVYGTPLTLALVKEKLIEHEIDDIELIPVRPRDTVNLGAFRIEFIRITHSIVDGVALGITTPVGSIVHTGDFKLDPTPVDGELMDFHKFSEYGEKGTLFLLSDSTNSEKGGFTFSEKEVRRAFEDVFSRSSGRIIISTFASNIHRIQQAVDVAVQFNRKVIMCGRSIVTNSQIALDHGYLKIPQDEWMRLETLKDIPDEQVVIITTGSQGEPLSVLSRIASDEHKHIKIKPGDTVILSAKAIPGNERSIGRIINRLMKRGAEVIYEKVSEIHVSGHASKEELKLMMNLVKPKFFIPIHGEYRQLNQHARLAEKSGISKENIFILEDGSILESDGNTCARAGKATSGRIFIDGKGITGVEDIVLRDRRRLGHDGIVIVITGIEKVSKKIISGPDIITKGFVFEEISADFINEAKGVVSEALAGMDEDTITDTASVQAKIRSALKKHIKNTMERRPMIMPIIMEV